MRDINQIIIHCAYTPVNMSVGVEDIDRWHKERGWSGIGYHFVITRAGTVDIGRPLEKPGAHAKGYNKNSIGICLVGGKPDFNFTFFQLKALQHLVEELRFDYEIVSVLGHRDLPGVRKSCPGFSVRSWFRGSL